MTAIPSLPATLGPYRLEREIGQGAMGVVYGATHTGLGRPVALKLLRAGEGLSATMLGRFRREAQIAARLSHPHIVTVHDAGEIDGTSYIAMDLVEGPTLEAARSDRRRSRSGLVPVLAKVARAVHYAHGQGVVHRDLKPSNILLDAQGEPHVTDFGLAKMVGQADGLTRTGSAIGTPFYMAPEQVLGRHREVDARTDVYALGIMLYELLTGIVPFHDISVANVYQKILKGDPQSPRSSHAGVSAGLETVCLRAISRERDKRYLTARAFAEDLEAVLEGRAVSAIPHAALSGVLRAFRRRPWIAAALAGVLLVASVTLWQLAGSRLRGRAADGLERRGDEQAGRGEWGQAIASYSEALALRDSPTVRQKRGEALAKAAPPAPPPVVVAADPGEAKPAVDMGSEVQRARERLNRGLSGLVGTGIGLDDMWRAFDEAKDAASGVLAIHPENVEALRISAWAHRMSDDLSRAESEFARVVTLDPAPFTSRFDLVCLRFELAFAEACYYGTDLDGKRRWERYRARALPEIGEALARSGGDAPGRVLLQALEAALQGRPVDAERVLGEGYERTRNFELLRYGAMMADSDRAALEKCSQALARNPRFYSALIVRGLIRYRQRDWRGAADDFGRALEINPSSARALCGKGSALGELKEFAGALESLDRSIALDGGSWLAWGKRGFFRLDSGKHQGAEADFTRAIELNPEMAFLHNALGAMCVKRGDLEAGRKAWERAVAVQPGYSMGWVNLGNLDQQQGKFQEALANFDRALQGDSADFRAHEGRASTLVKLEDWAGALEAVEKCLRLAPADHGDREKWERARVQLRERLGRR